MKENERFVRTQKEGSGFGNLRELWVDKQTGVTYLWMCSGYAGGLTPLLDVAGNPVISRIPRED